MTMKHPIKLIIQRKVIYSEEFKRFFTVDRLLLTDDSPIKTEAQLAYHIFKNFGVGRYMCLAFQKGNWGFWNFWIGYIMENGFIRDLRKNKEFEKLQNELRKAQTYEERESIEEDMNLEKEINEETKRIRKSGPVGLIKSRPGILNSYEQF